MSGWLLRKYCVLPALFPIALFHLTLSTVPAAQFVQAEFVGKVRNMAAFSVATPTVAQTSQSQAPAAKPSLRISGEVEKPLTLSAEELAKLPRRSVRAKDHDGKESDFEGTSLVEILTLAGVKFGEGLRGKNLELYLVVEATDGYRAVYALPELDPAYTDKVIILADKRDGKAMDANEGPLRIVVPDEKRQSRWVRQVTGFVIKRAQ